MFTGALALLLQGGALAEPTPRNPFLADSGIAGVHYDAWAQQSSDLEGPTALGPNTKVDELLTGSLGFPLLSSPYSNGKRAIWLSTQGHVFKIDPNGSTLKVIDRVQKEGRYPFSAEEAVTWIAGLDAAVTIPAFVAYMNEVYKPAEKLRAEGGYAVIGADNRFYFAADRTRIVSYGDAKPGDFRSRIMPLGRLAIPAEILIDPAEQIYGLMMAWDGRIAFVTTHGLVGLASDDLTSAEYLRIEGERVSNSIATDEAGGIYVVTDKRLHRVMATPAGLTLDPKAGAWSETYDSTGEQSDIQLGAGSGSTPTLMGAGSDDRLVVITDGARIMNLVAYWRDEIPADWKGLPGRSRRVAGLVPVTFGDQSAEETRSEQSVLVNGYGALVVNNTLDAAPTKAPVINALLSGRPDLAPKGAERFVWDPASRALKSQWARRDVSFPNTVPTMSRASDLVYGVAVRGPNWMLEGLDWDSGETKLSFILGPSVRWNSVYTTTMVYPGRSIVYGTFFGIVRIRP